MSNRFARRTAGPADPATVHRELEKRLAEREPASTKTPEKARRQEDMPAPTIANAARALKGRHAKIEEAIGE
jgi:hypothetical protein